VVSRPLENEFGEKRSSGNPEKFSRHDVQNLG